MRQNPREGGYDDRTANEAFRSASLAQAGKPYYVRHWRAFDDPRGEAEEGIVGLISGWLDYADDHREAHGSQIGNDSYVGPYWLDIGKNIIGLLSAEFGSRMDSGLMDAGLREAMESQGFGEEDMA